MTKRIVHGLIVNKIAAVDFPCQEPAVVAVIKRAADAYDKLLKGKYSADDREEGAKAGWAMKDGSYPVKDAEDLGKAIHAVGRGKNNSHAAIRRHIIDRAKALGLSDQIPDDWKDGDKIGKALCDAIVKAGIKLDDPDGDAGARGFDEVLGAQKLTQQFWDAFYKGTDSLRESLCSIINDDEVDDKQSMISDSLKEFADYIGEILPGPVGKALAAGVAATIAGSARQTTGDDMSAITKALGLPDTATETEILKALADKDTLAKSRVEKMSDKHSAFMAHEKAKMPKGGKEAFQEMSAAERDKHIADNPIEDEPAEDDVEKSIKTGAAFRSIDGAVVFKAKVGAETYAILKGMDEGRKKDRKELDDAKEEKAEKQYIDLAKAHGFAEAFAPTLRKALEGAPPEARNALLTEMKALKAQAEAGLTFKELGSRGNGSGDGTAMAELKAKADELKKSMPTLSNEQAFARVYKARENADIVRRYKAEAAGQA